MAVSHFAEQALGEKDDARIIIDEWIGAWIALWGLRFADPWVWVLAFVAFRFFDALKGPLKPLQKIKGGWGVTLDDVAAGVLANVLARGASLL